MQQKLEIIGKVGERINYAVKICFKVNFHKQLLFLFFNYNFSRAFCLRYNLVSYNGLLVITLN